jgi:alpha-1,3-rhamnosyl/mannosyltransferase
MRIVIDAITLLLRGAGVKNYLHYWLLSLLEAAPERGDTITTYPPAMRASSALDHQRPLAGPLGALLRLQMVHFVNLRGNPALNLFLFGADVFHCSQHTANLPWNRKTTATVFDLSCWTTPENHTPENIAATRRYGERILKACDGLIAISAHARQDAIEILRIPQERIRVIYPGVAEPFFRVTPRQTEEIRAKYGLDAPYILFVGCIEPRKNVPNLIRAYQQLPASIRRDVHLVLAGPFGWASEELRTMLTSTSDTVRYLGYVPEPDLPGLFRGATTLVYPSYYEGFGLPVAQAMATGIPVIASDRACLPEVVGDAGLCINPDSVDELSAAMHRILTSLEFAEALASRGKTRARKFHWSTSAAESLDFFHEVAGGR